MDRDLWLQHFAEVPANRFALAVFVRRQVEVFGILERRPKLLHLLGLLWRYHVNRLEPWLTFTPR